MLLSLGAVSACASDQTYLPALLADPMAEYSHPGLEQFTRSETPKAFNPSGSQMKPSVLTTFAVVGDFEVEEAVAAAEAAGWSFEPTEPEIGSGGNRTWSATKELSEGLAGLSINSLPSNAAQEWDLSIKLFFWQEY